MRFISSLLYVAYIYVPIYADNNTHKWNYGIYGPDMWPEEYPSCEGENQSPIDIDDSLSTYDPYLKPLEFHNYDKNTSWIVRNNGHTVAMAPLLNNFNERLTVIGPKDPEVFSLQNIHFHWGENNHQGSEHLMNNKKYPLEMHLVHRSDKNSFSVLGFMFKLSTEDNIFLNPIIEAISKAVNYNDNATTHFQLDQILPFNVDPNLHSYYRYLGSLTTPPCTEGIIWNFFMHPINISEEQMHGFHSNSINKNFRYTQVLHHRRILRSVPLQKDNSHVSSPSDAKTHGSKSEASSLSNKFVLFCTIFTILKLTY